MMKRSFEMNFWNDVFSQLFKKSFGLGTVFWIFFLLNLSDLQDIWFDSDTSAAVSQQTKKNYAFLWEICTQCQDYHRNHVHMILTKVEYLPVYCFRTDNAFLVISRFFQIFLSKLEFSSILKICNKEAIIAIRWKSQKYRDTLSLPRTTYTWSLFAVATGDPRRHYLSGS